MVTSYLMWGGGAEVRETGGDTGNKLEQNQKGAVLRSARSFNTGKSVSWLYCSSDSVAQASFNDSCSHVCRGRPTLFFLRFADRSVFPAQYCKSA